MKTPFELHIVPDWGAEAVEGARWVEVWKEGKFPCRSYMHPDFDPVLLALYIEPGETPEEVVEAVWFDYVDCGGAFENGSLDTAEKNALIFAAREMGVAI